MFSLSFSEIGILLLASGAITAGFANDVAHATVWQKNLLERVSISAAKLSQDSEELLLRRMEQPEFRKGLAKCCPSICNLPATVLLSRLQAEIRVSEVVSGFPAVEAYGTWDMTLADGYRGSYFENQWQVRVAHNGSFGNTSAGGWFGTQDDVETKLYGLKPFAIRGHPNSSAEASERGPYCAINDLRVDAGSPLYGAISAVFSQARMRETALLSAVDTGSFQSMCNGSFPWDLGKRLEHNCSAYPRGPNHLGTMDHFNHLLLINDAYWNGTAFGTLLSRFARLVAEPEAKLHGWGEGYSLKGTDFIHYFEAIPAGMLRYPHDVKFLIGKFPDLFGTIQGAELQQWCLKQGWLLVWSLGLNAGQDLNFFSAPYMNGTFPSNKRLLDPIVASGISTVTNMSLGGTTDHFYRIWWAAQHALAVAALDNSTVNGSIWANLFSALRDGLRPELHLEPLRAASCADPDRCIGTNGYGDCVCYARGRADTDTASLIV